MNRNLRWINFTAYSRPELDKYIVMFFVAFHFFICISICKFLVQRSSLDGPSIFSYSVQSLLLSTGRHM